MTYINEQQENGQWKTVAWTCDLEGERVENTGDVVWFEPTREDPKDMSHYDMFSCTNCERIFSRKAQRTLRSEITRWKGVWEYHCGECERDLGIFRLRQNAHGMLLNYRMTDENLIIPHFTRAKRYGDTYPLQDEDTYRYKRGLEHRFSEWFSKRNQARVTEFSLFDMYHDEQHGWCVDTETDWNPLLDADRFVAQGFNRFMDYFSAHFMLKEQSWKYLMPVVKRAFGRPLYHDFRVRVFDWRTGDDGIGGWNSPIIFQVIMYSGASQAMSLTVLCNSESYGQDDRWDNTDSFNALDLYMAMVEHMGLRHIAPEIQIHSRDKATVTQPQEEE